MLHVVLILIAVLTLVSPLAYASGARITTVSSGFTFQGQLTQNGEPVNEPADLIIRLFDAESGGTQLGELSFNAFPIGQNGLFTLELDFGGDTGTFPGEPRWLEILVRIPAGGGGYTALDPRQKLTTSPYSLHSQTVGYVPESALMGPYSGITVVGTLTDLDVSGSAIVGGRIGIGTGSPISALEVFSFTEDWDGLWTRTTGLNSKAFYGYQAGSVIAQHVLDAEANNWRLRIGGTDRFVIDAATGNAGFGTDNPGTARLRSMNTTGYGLWGQTEGTGSNAAGVIGVAGAVNGTARGVQGIAISPDGYAGYFQGARNYFDGNVGIGVADPQQRLHVNGSILAETTNWAIRGTKTGTGTFPGVWGETESTSSLASGVRGDVTSESPGSASAGVWGRNLGTTGEGYGVRGTHSGSGAGVFGGVESLTGVNEGVFGLTLSTSGRGVYGEAIATTGQAYGGYFESASSGGSGVYGTANSTSGGFSSGVRGNTLSAGGAGVVGVDGGGPTSHGVYCFGKFTATGTKAFQIDHPADPANMYLQHFCAEGPEPLNIYSGVVELGETGEAWVELPRYYASINRDPRYQLTCIGSYAQVYIAEEIDLTSPVCGFRIAGGAPGLKVSWEVKSVRNDPAVRANGAIAEVPKPPWARGTYLHPEHYGQPASAAQAALSAPIQEAVRE